VNYILLPVFVMFVIGYKVWNKTKFVDVMDIDLQTGRRPEIPEHMKAPREEEKKKSWALRLRRVFVG
jgi:amino acid transporter